MSMNRLLPLLLCLFGSSWLWSQAPNPSYNPDWDGDGNLGVTDLLGFLGLFGDSDVDSDGIWDSIDQCIGVYDVCGVCNGPGLPEGISNCDELYGACSGIETVSFDGHDYPVVGIGNQCWFQQNLRTFHYSNGDVIPMHPENGDWANAIAGACAIFNDDSTTIENGLVYNWYAVADERGLCPSGWHVPSDEEWIELELYVGMPDSVVYDHGFRGTFEGAKLKSAWDDTPPWNGVNMFGFSAIQAGRRNRNGNYDSSSGYAHIWTSSEGETWGDQMAYMRYLSNGDQIHRAYWYYHKEYGLSVRCMKDN